MLDVREGYQARTREWRYDKPLSDFTKCGGLYDIEETN